MRGDSQASPRLLAAVPGRRWSEWISETRGALREARADRLELIERAASEQRRTRRSGEYVPDLGSRPRWS
jgi:hypothetical protein